MPCISRSIFGDDSQVHPISSPLSTPALGATDLSSALVCTASVDEPQARASVVSFFLPVPPAPGTPVVPGTPNGGYSGSPGSAGSETIQLPTAVPAGGGVSPSNPSDSFNGSVLSSSGGGAGGSFSLPTYSSGGWTSPAASPVLFVLVTGSGPLADVPVYFYGPFGYTAEGNTNAQGETALLLPSVYPFTDGQYTIKIKPNDGIHAELDVSATVSGAAKITAVLSKNAAVPTVSITDSPTAGGSTSPSGVKTGSAGDTLPVTATANSGYTFDHWELNGVNVSSSSTYNYTFGSGTDALVAVFTSTSTPIGQNVISDTLPTESVTWSQP